MSAGAAGAAGAAAAARARRRREEEETMATYTQEDLAAGFEFKFLRSATGRFRNQDFLRRSLEEEQTAGWTLVEKFDHQRIRLKRPVTARSGDARLTFDPYRTEIGMTEGSLALTIVLTVLAVIGLAAGITFAVVRR